jgi:MFS family permease
VGLPFAVLRVGGSTRDIGLVLAALTTTQAGLLLAGGAIADRLPRRLVLLAAEVLLGLTQALLGLLLVTGHGSVRALVAMSILYGAGVALSLPAMTGLLPQVVGAERLQQANALLGMSQNLALVAGPVPAAVLVGLWQPGWLFIGDAATFMVSAGCLASLTVSRQRREQRTRFLADLIAGFDAVRVATQPSIVDGLP